jgi:hypothetical protein
MSEPQDGGPAFPGQQDYTNGEWNQTWEPGMSLRDWFAGQALAGICSAYFNGRMSFKEGENVHDSIASGCGMIADAMIAERSKEAK